MTALASNFTALQSIFEVRVRLNIWQWADKYRVLERGVSHKSANGDARFNSSDAPHQREIQDAALDKSVQMTVVIGASQLFGKTEIVNNIVCYHVHYKPRSMVIMYSIIESMEKFSKKKLAPALRATPEVHALVSGDKSRSSGNTISVKEFLGGSIFIVTSGSTAALRGATGSVLIGDEVDDYEDDIGGQGDPVELLWKRGESFPDTIKMLFSTPTLDGRSKIWSRFMDSDQRFWFMPCVHCGKEIIFKKSHASKLDNTIPCAVLEYEKDKAEHARMVCQECFAEITDSQRIQMYRSGAWRPTAEFRGIRGYHLSSLYAHWPAGRGFKNRLHQFAEEWESAKKKGENSLKVIINTGLCETFAEAYEKPPDDEALMLRCEPYAGEIPEPVVYLTCFVDVQKDRLEFEICGWGEMEESWGIETGKLFGDPQLPAVWLKLDEKLFKVYDHPSGARMRISCAMIDSGGQSDNRAFAIPVYGYVKRRQSRYIFAAKGSSVLGAPPLNAHLQKNGIELQNIGTDNCKSAVYARLEITTPGPEYCHFPVGRGYDAEYFKQLTAEQVSTVDGKRVWVKRRQRNEALDMRAGNIAAFLKRRPNLKAIAKNLRASLDSKEKSEESKPESSPVASTAPAAVLSKPRPERRRFRSKFMRM